MITHKKLNILKSCANEIKNLATSLERAVKEWKKNMNKAMEFRSETRNFRHVKHLHLVLFAKEQIVFQKIAGVVLLLLTDLDGWNNTNQQTLRK